MLVYLVDDDLIQNTITSQVIGVVSREVNTAVFNNGEELLNEIKNGGEPDIILLDINMPIMNGWEFLEKYQDYQRQAKVYMLTSSENDEDKKRADEFSCVKGYFSKPITPTIVGEIIG